jgi:hypothetical protein
LGVIAKLTRALALCATLGVAFVPFTSGVALACEGAGGWEEALPTKITFHEVGEIVGLEKKAPPVKVLMFNLKNVFGGTFTGVTTCVGKESPPCEIEIKFSGPNEEASESTLMIELEKPPGSGKTKIETIKLVR